MKYARSCLFTLPIVAFALFASSLAVAQLVSVCDLEKESFDFYPGTLYEYYESTNCYFYVPAQSFRPQEDYTLCSVSVVLDSASGSWESATLFVQEGPNETDPVLTQASIYVGPKEGWYTFDVPDYDLIQNQEYFIRVSGQVMIHRYECVPGDCYFGPPDYDPYPRGAAYLNGELIEDGEGDHIDHSFITRTPQEYFQPQPYIVYFVGSEAVSSANVDLEDQFITELAVPVSQRQYLMNPVEKDPVDPEGRTEEITDPALHYRWFPIPLTPVGDRVVKVSNQFAFLQPWRIADMPEFLLAPASKAVAPGSPGPPPDTGHHYDCYAVVDAPPAGAVVNLNDQFAFRANVPVTAARYLCAPVQKTKGAELFATLPAIHGKDHLACYDIPAAAYDVDVNTEDQFGPSAIVAGEVDQLLCVPTRKTYPAEDAVPSLGPWGMVALGLSILVLVSWVGRRIRPGEAA